MSRQILIRGHLEMAGGYGQVTIAIARGLINRGYDVRIWPLAIEENEVPIPQEVRDRCVSGSRAPTQLLIWLPERDIGHKVKRTVHFTMWETARLPEKSLAVLGRASGVVVPSDWNASCFVAQGLDRPIHKVPLPVDTGLYWPEPFPKRGPFVFGTAGRNWKGVYRKRMDWVMDAFSKAFNQGENVRLRVKCWPTCVLPEPDDPRIEIVRECLSPDGMAAWFNSLHCYVTACAGGGWELMPHQAMSCGRPVIGPRFGGMAEYFDDRAGWELPYSYGRAEDHYAGCGRWADVDRAGLIQAMRSAFETSDMTAMGRRAAHRAQQFTLDRTLDALIPVLEKHRIFF